MNNKILFILSWGILIISFVSAQTTIPAGNVSGTWTGTGSPYLIQGNITIHSDSTLTIEPGIEVIFQGHYRFIVNGSLYANGTVSDSIYFVPADTTTRWNGIEFRDSNGSLTYTNVSYTSIGLGAVYFNNSTVDLSHCTINDNTAQGSGGLDIGFGNHVTVSHCSIIRNSAGLYGGGIGLRDSSYLSISNSEISFNQNYYSYSTHCGGGIWSSSSDSLLIDNCIFNHNTSGSRTSGSLLYGGAISVDYGDGFVKITNSTFIDNYAANYGGALYLENCQSIISKNNFESNVVNGVGAAIYLKNCNATLSYNIFQKNKPPYQGGAIGGVVFIGDSSVAIIDHCNFYNNGWLAFGDRICHIAATASVIIKNSIFSDHAFDFHIWFVAGCFAEVKYSNFFNALGNFAGTVPAGLGTISGVNANGMPCDTFYNIYMDPLYVDPVAGNFNLQSTSPCIDAGDPASPNDPDNTIADMGKYYFNQFRPLISTSDSLLYFGIVDIGQQLDLPLTIRNTGPASLHLQNMINQHSVFNNNWNPVDTLILPGDSLIVTVTFTPADTNLIVDTLLIENNDKPLQVELSGKGKIMVGIEDKSELPKVYSLYPAYPNPFNPSTTFEFDLPR
ncbi:right-handed parallel beta-helix repeat-containing protein, partial [bacterium]|nr:right-handed parallel beta-helix repeat-containing protein [bacterium]